MRVSKLKDEGEKWVAEKIITNEQLEKILARYPKKDPNFIIILFAIILTSLGFLTFMMSDWAQVAHISRVLIVVLVMLGFYITGDLFLKRHLTLYGISFIVLGFVVFGAGLWLTITIYNINIFHAWPFFIWGLLGLILYFIYDHYLLFIAGTVVITAGQLYSGMELASFDWFIFFLLLFGYAHFVYHKAYPMFGYLFGFSFSLQLVVLTIVESQQYYWPIVYFLILYLIGEFMVKHTLKNALKYTSIISIFIFGMYQTFMLQEDFFIQDISKEWLFILIWIILIAAITFIKITKKTTVELIDFLLFIPVIYLPYSYILSLVILFVFALLWILVGYRYDYFDKIMMGTITFLLSIFIVYIQYAWDTMNKSLFFLIGGLLLFLISFLIEKQRRLFVGKQEGGSKK